MPSPSETVPSIAQLNTIAQQIINPHDFFNGVATHGGPLPINILLFMRRDELTLGANPRLRSHHHRTVLIVALHGSGHACIDAESFPLKAGDALVIFPFQFHTYANVQEISWLFITFEMLTLDPLEPLRSSGPRRLGPVERMLLRETLHCWLQKEQRPLLGQHLGLLLDRMASMPATPPGSPCGSLPEPLPPTTADLEHKTHMLALVNSYALPLINSGQIAPNIATLAGALNLSESHLRTQFRQTTGRSLGGHLRSLRIQRACSLLHTTRLSITEVATQCGFESVYSFSRTFRVARGVTPSAYRKGQFEDLHFQRATAPSP